MSDEDGRIHHELLLWLHTCERAMSFVRELQDTPERRQLHRAIEDQLEREKKPAGDKPTS